MFSAGVVAEADRVAAVPALQAQARRVVASPDLRAREAWLVGLKRHVPSGSDVHRSSVALLAGGLLLRGALLPAVRRTPQGSRGGRRTRTPPLSEAVVKEALDVLVQENVIPSGAVANLTLENLRKAWRAWSQPRHPDQSAISPDAVSTAHFASVSAAYSNVMASMGAGPAAGDAHEHIGHVEETLRNAMIDEETARITANRASAEAAIAAQAALWNMALTALIATAVIGAAVYFLWYRPRQRRRAQQLQARLQRQQLELSQAIHAAAAQVQQETAAAVPRAGGTDMRVTANVGVRQAQGVEQALRLPPAQTGGALTRAIQWAHKQLAAAWHAVRAAAARALHVATRFARKWSPSRWWPSPAEQTSASAPTPTPMQDLAVAVPVPVPVPVPSSVHAMPLKPTGTPTVRRPVRPEQQKTKRTGPAVHRRPARYTLQRALTSGRRLRKRTRQSPRAHSSRGVRKPKPGRVRRWL